MQPINFNETLEKLVDVDRRYPRDAYIFVREALDYTQREAIKKAGRLEVRHVTGQELLDGIRQYALDEFGPMAITVLSEWNIGRCEDFGELVFNMVAAGLLNKTDNDRREDFKGGYDFREAFVVPFQPAASAGPSEQPPTGARLSDSTPN